MKWIKTSDSLPEKHEEILCLLHYDLDNPEILSRMDPIPVPFETLHEYICEDKTEDFDYNQRHGYVVGACYEFCKGCYYNGKEDDYEKKDYENNFFLAKEVSYWCSIPERPKEIE